MLSLVESSNNKLSLSNQVPRWLYTLVACLDVRWNKFSRVPKQKLQLFGKATICSFTANVVPSVIFA